MTQGRSQPRLLRARKGRKDFITSDFSASRRQQKGVRILGDQGPSTGSWVLDDGVSGNYPSFPIWKSCS